MKRLLQRAVVAVVLRVVHAAIVELQQVDSRARDELERVREGTSYAIHTAHAGGPSLYVQWEGGVLRRKRFLENPGCLLRLKAMPVSFLLFTGRMGMAQAYARHAFSLRGEISDVMALARLVDLVEAYLFPRFVTRRILTEVPLLQACPLRVYGRICCGFLTGRYRV